MGADRRSVDRLFRRPPGRPDCPQSTLECPSGFFHPLACAWGHHKCNHRLFYRSAVRARVILSKPLGDLKDVTQTHVELQVDYVSHEQFSRGPKRVFRGEAEGWLTTAMNSTPFQVRCVGGSFTH